MERKSHVVGLQENRPLKKMKESPLRALYTQCMTRPLFDEAETKSFTTKPTPKAQSSQKTDLQPGSFIFVSQTLDDDITCLEYLDISNEPIIEVKKKNIFPQCLSVVFDVQKKHCEIKSLESERKTIQNRLVQLLYDTAPHLVARVAKVKIEGPFEKRAPGHDVFIQELKTMCVQGFKL